MFGARGFEDWRGHDVVVDTVFVVIRKHVEVESLFHEVIAICLRVLVPRELWQREQWYNGGGKYEKSAEKIARCVVDVSSNEMVQPQRLEVSVGAEVLMIEWRWFYVGDTLVGAVSTNNNT